jgi:SAM-dependent methyltransferase
MPVDANGESRFYATARGRVAARLLRRRLHRLWPLVRGQSVLGIGYAVPYLHLWHGEAARCIAFAPPHVGAVHWPTDGRALSCGGAEDALPFPDLSFDCVLLIHALEVAEHPRTLLREVWRILRDDGRLLVAVPNRRGMWAHLESTPFGQGRPYSVGQLGQLLATSLFRVERQDTALFVPPLSFRPLLRGAGVWESVGRMLLPGFAGLLIIEAMKNAYGVIPLAEPARRRYVLADIG